eukprot:4326861-Ditylum_brightwellii.AAC.1
MAVETIHKAETHVSGVEELYGSDLIANSTPASGRRVFVMSTDLKGGNGTISTTIKRKRHSRTNLNLFASSVNFTCTGAGDNANEVCAVHETTEQILELERNNAEYKGDGGDSDNECNENDLHHNSVYPFTTLEILDEKCPAGPSYPAVELP